jgi:hypothetical protein
VEYNIQWVLSPVLQGCYNVYRVTQPDPICRYLQIRNQTDLVMTLQKYFCLLAFTLLAGCQTTPLNFDNARSVPPPGTIVELNQNLEFARGVSRSYIQYGEALGSHGKYNSYEPWCQFYLYEPQSMMKNPRTIEADRFTVVKSYQNIDYVLKDPMKLAFVGSGIGDGGEVYPLVTTMILQSEKQPQVRELRCSNTDNPYPSNFVSVNKIIEVLGNVATLHLPPMGK